jgi:hypothetical protein
MLGRTLAPASTGGASASARVESSVMRSTVKGTWKSMGKSTAMLELERLDMRRFSARAPQSTSRLRHLSVHEP